MSRRRQRDTYGFDAERAHREAQALLPLSSAQRLAWLCSTLPRIQLQEAALAGRVVRNAYTRRGNGAPVLLVGAHYDGPYGVAGTTVLVELLRQLEHHPLTKTIQCVFFDASEGRNRLEDAWLGARLWVKQPPLPRPAQTVLLDRIGGPDLRLFRERISERKAKPIHDSLWKVAAQRHESHFRFGFGPELYGDQIPLHAAGWGAVLLTDPNGQPGAAEPVALGAVGGVLLQWLRG